MSRRTEADSCAPGASTPRRPKRAAGGTHGRAHLATGNRALAANGRGPTEAGVLFVCTGNICRSVMAETFFQSRADMEGWPLRATSAGLTGEGARPPRHAAAIMRRRGIDVSAHVSRRLTGSMVDVATLVIGSCPEHAWAAATLRPDAAPRIFTLKELVRLAERAKRAPAGEGLGAWISHVDALRRQDEATNEADDTIDDPKGKSRRTYERVALEVERLVFQLVDLVGPAMTSIRAHPAARPRIERRLPEVRS